jgi:hypothetical protein
VELTGTEKSKIAKFDAMNAAHKAGRPEVVLMILSGQLAVRSRRSGMWSIRDYQREVPAGAVAMVYVDYTGRRPEYYIVPAGEAREILKKRYDAWRNEHAGERPRTPESGHVGLSLGEIQHWRNAWTSWATSAPLTK